MLASIFLVIIERQNSFRSLIFAGFHLPLNPIGIGRISGRARDANNIAFPINSDEADFLLGQPRKHVKGNAAAAVQKNYSLG